MNYNGRRDTSGGVYTELDPLSADSDGDGLQDGYEKHETAAPNGDTCTVATGSCASAWLFAAASSGTPATDPLDRDSDDDGLSDLQEEQGTWCYIAWPAVACGGSAHSERVTNPNAPRRSWPSH